MKETRGQAIANWLMDRKWISFMIICVPTLMLALHIPKIEVYSRFADLLPAKHDYIVTYNRMKQTFGGANVVTMALETTDKNSDIFTTDTLNKVRRLTEEIDLIQGVNHYQVASIAHPKIRRVRTTAGGMIKSEPVLPKQIPTDAAGLKQLREESFNNDIVYGTYISADGRSALILAGFDEERLNYVQIHTRLQQLKAEVEKDGKTKLFIAGEPMLKGWIYFYSKELKVIFGVTLLVMVALLWIHFGSITGVVVPSLGTGLSAIWGLGFVGWMGYNLDPLILVVPILISSRTASHCVQMMERYYDEIRLGREREAAVRVAMGELILPASLGILADAFGLLVLALSSMPMIAKLGYYCAFWGTSNLVTVAILVPLVMSLLPTPTVTRQEEHKHLPSRIMHTMGVFLVGEKATYTVFGFSALLAVWAFYYGWTVQIGESKPGSPILFPDSEYNVAAAHIADQFAGANQLSIFFEGDAPHKMKDPEVVATMEEFGRYMSNTFNYGGTRSIPHLVRSINRLYHYDDPRWSLIPATQKDIGNTLFMYEAGAAVPGVILEYMDLEGRTANFVIFYKDATGRTVHEAIAAAKSFLDKHPLKGVTPRFAGGIIGTTAAANEETEASDLKMTTSIIVLVTISIIVAYRSLFAGLMVFIVLILCVMTNRAFMTMRDIGLNVNTLPVTSVGIGVGVDYTIYMLDRLKEEVRHRSLIDGIITSMRTTGAAILFTAVTVLAGIVYWIPGSSLRFNSEMALLLCLLLTSNMIGAITLIPLFVRIFKPGFVMESHIDDADTKMDQSVGGWQADAISKQHA
ncbi:MAG: MMPL family transporter [Gammaproteobacteria bacterium]|nr:MMPL family transporter [Gammaproteobacteria bacterium]MBI5616106.1 MMPL family transporter [Gammaproteobacteria bacterium]